MSADRNREVVEAIFERAWGGGDFDGLDESFAPSFDFHIRGMSRPMGLDELRRIVADWRKAFPDLWFHIEDLVADADIVAARARLTGTHQGPWQDMEPTGYRIDVEHMFFFRFEGDRLVEVWEMLDRETMQSQLHAGTARTRNNGM